MGAFGNEGLQGNQTFDLDETLGVGAGFYRVDWWCAVATAESGAAIQLQCEATDPQENQVVNAMDGAIDGGDSSASRSGSFLFRYAGLESGISGRTFTFTISVFSPGGLLVYDCRGEMYPVP